MKSLKRKEFVFVSFMLFSMFFGAGNLIFPPYLGESAGGSTFLVLLPFLVTSVMFPVLGVAAVVLSGGLKNLTERVSPLFALVFTVSIYLAIGPFLAIPRAASLPFEMIANSYEFSSGGETFGLLLFTLVFFGLSYWLSLSPGKLVNRLGKILTPVILLLVVILFLGSFFVSNNGYGIAVGDYASSPLSTGFLDGYFTMDTLAALNFGIVIALTVKGLGILDKKNAAVVSIKAGVVAGVLLVVVYAMLAHLGALSGGLFGQSENGAATLVNIVTHIFGDAGVVLLVTLFTLACITTSVGLITSTSQYFATLTNKLDYKFFVRAVTVVSLMLANLGLSTILKVSVPVLFAIYPIAIVLILLSLFYKSNGKNDVVYQVTVGMTAVVSCVDALEKAGLSLPGVSNLFQKLPLYSVSLGWILVSSISFLVIFVFKKSKKELFFK
ncbi:MAG: branched-chain amino acid transport system II carrier protein [Candidatus Izemoplasma sp.]